MEDRIITATARDGSLAVAAGLTTELVREARRRHDLAPTASAALGRLLTAAALLGATLRGQEIVALQVAGDGPLGRLFAEARLLADGALGVRGYVDRPHADLPLNSRGKFDVGAAVGTGRLQVTRSSEVGNPYVGVVPLVSGEIGDDVAGYLAQSEQIPSVVAVGVLSDPAGIRAAGGSIAQVMPSANESAIVALEMRAGSMEAVTRQIVAGAEPRVLAERLVGVGMLRAVVEYPVRFACRCSRAKVEAALAGLGRDELALMARERPQTEATCEVCRERYVLTRADLAGLVDRLAAGDETT